MWDYRKPFFDEALRLSAELTFTVTADDLSETDLVRAFHHHFEDAVFASFTIGGLTPAVRRVLKSCGDGIIGDLDPFGERLLASPAMHATWPDLAIDEVHDVLPPGSGWLEVVGPLMLEGHLASALHHGGAYSHAAAVDSVRLARNFRQRFIADRYDDLFVLTAGNYCEWFHMVTGDYAWIMTDLRAAKVHLLCASGSD